MVVFVSLALFVWNDVSKGAITPEVWNLVDPFVLYYVMYDLANVVTMTYIARMETTKSQLIALTDPAIRVPLIIFISINHMTQLDLAFAYVFAALGVLLVAIPSFQRHGPVEAADLVPFLSHVRSSHHFHFGTPMPSPATWTRS